MKPRLAKLRGGADGPLRCPRRRRGELDSSGMFLIHSARECLMCAALLSKPRLAFGACEPEMAQSGCLAGRRGE